ncbi:tyrosine--tRNA ligase [Candidatus Berkelbacteria bacterium]|nr:tyrosine--tRNA ligase [Candidatus Berkelbacteria bacterium]
MTTPYWRLAADKIYPSKDRLVRTLKARSLRIYFGADPTAPFLHLGHTVPLKILRELQEQGHRVVVLFGDFTTLIGDPSGRDQSRPTLDEQAIATNLLTYREQVLKILDPKKTEFRSNSEWYLNPRSSGALREFLRLGLNFTAAQLWERDLFQERQKKGQPVSLTEFIYPVLQAYDFIALEADAQVGGTDQTFNMLAGRDLAKKLGKGEKFVITTQLLRGTDGHKMGKSFNNFIALTDAPNEMYGKLMSVRDELLPEYFMLAVGIDPNASKVRTLIDANPREAKAKMAYEVVAFYHGADRALMAQKAFDQQFQAKELPGEIENRTPSVTGNEKLAFYLVDLDLATSKTEAGRLIEQGGVKVDGAVIADLHALITPHDGMLIQVGKRHFVRIKL